MRNSMQKTHGKNAKKTGVNFGCFGETLETQNPFEEMPN